MNKKLEEKIERLEAELLERYRDDRELFGRLDRAQADLGILDDGRPFSPFLRPLLMTRRKYGEIAGAAETLAAAFETMTLAALDNGEIMEILDLTPAEERLARVDPGYTGVCHSSRLDTFLHGEDFRFLEYNGETPAGIIDQMQIEKVLFEIPEVREFLATNEHWRPAPHVRLLKALVGAYREFGGEEERPNIAIVDWRDVATVTEFEVLREFFGSEGHECAIVSPLDLEYDGRFLRAGEFRIDIFYKRVLIHEFLERCGEDNPLTRAYRDGNLFMANSFRAKIPHKKASLAVLGDERFRDLFTEEQRAAIDRHIPWTRRVRRGRTDLEGHEIDLVGHLRENRAEFLLKPNDDYGGSGIVFGWESSAEEWAAALETALGRSYVVQRRVPVEKIRFPTYEGGRVRAEELLVDFDPFLFRGRVEGGLVRLSASTLVNVAQGGGETALVVVEDEGA